MIACKELTKSYKNGGSEQIVLDSVNLSVDEGEFLVIMGESGCGKSTLLYSLSGMDAITSGEVYLGEKRIDTYTENQMKALRLNTFGFVFQDLNLVDVLTIEENIALPAYENKSYNRQVVIDLMERFNIRHCADKYPNKVSGGERQRAAIARAIINAPDILFLDEPTGSLDHGNTVNIMELFKDLNSEGQTIIMVTHDDYCASFGNRLVYLKNHTMFDQA